MAQETPTAFEALQLPQGDVVIVNFNSPEFLEHLAAIIAANIDPKHTELATRLLSALSGEAEDGTTFDPFDIFTLVATSAESTSPSE